MHTGAAKPAMDANYDTLGEQSTPQHTVVQIFIHTARKMDGELETLTVSQLKKIIKIPIGRVRTRIKPSAILTGFIISP